MGIDVVRLLEQIPIWKKLKVLPEKLAALEKRMSDLEAKVDAPGKKCPKCGKFSFSVESSTPDKTFGEAGGNNVTYKCASCGFSQSKIEI